jgi:hypothetical protein
MRGVRPPVVLRGQLGGRIPFAPPWFVKVRITHTLAAIRAAEEREMTFTRRSTRTVSARPRPTVRRPWCVTEALETRTLMAAVTDDFNDGNDAGWNHYAPLDQFGAPSTYELTNGTYRIAASESPDPGQLGPARAGSFRNDANFSDFTASIDLIDWDPSLDQAFGILARTSTPGLGSTNGYALSYSPLSGDLDISKVTGEAPDDLDPGARVILDPTAGDYRLVFEGRGDRLTGKLFDLTNLTTPLMTTHAIDGTYASGIIGVFVFSNTGDGSGPADATFDNYSADVAGPVDHTIAYYRFEEGTAGDSFRGPGIDGGTDSGLAVDEAGHDDPLRTFAGFSAPVYTSSNSGPIVRGGDIVTPNNLALDFTPNQDIYTAQRGDLNQHVFDQFTVEASFNLDTNDLWQGIVSKDGKPLATSDLAPLQLKHRMDNHNLQIEILDGEGNERQVQSLNPIVTGHWYHAAAVSDGTTLKLYLDDASDPEGFVLQGSVDITGGLYQMDSTWDVGRGFFGGNPTDWTDGRIDEVRISDVALDPSQFLYAPGPPFGLNVTQVFVNGPNLTSNAAFRTAAGAEVGFGYPIPGGAAQTRSIPWVSGVNAVSIRFSNDVTGILDQADLQVRGSAGTIATSTFSYDAPTKTGTWTFATPITNDKLRLVIDDAGLSGLDGDWTNPTTTTPAGDTYPSGDATSGGDFNFRINILRGDATGEGVVNALDLADVKRRLGRRPADGVTGAGAYSIFADITNDGVVNALDLAAVKQRLGNRLPIPDPATSIL